MGEGRGARPARKADVEDPAQVAHEAERMCGIFTNEGSRVRRVMLVAGHEAATRTAYNNPAHVGVPSERARKREAAKLKKMRAV